MTTMKAVRIHTYVGLQVLSYEDAPRPEAGEGEILIRAHAAGTNPVDWKIREGYRRETLGYQLSLILGWDVSGTVEEIGAGVSRFMVGDGVYARPDLGRNGAYAEYIAVRASEAARKPESLDFTQAAAVPLAALTAWQSLFGTAGLEVGQTALIHDAAGRRRQLCRAICSLEGRG